MIFCYTHNECLVQPSSEKPPLEADRNTYREPYSTRYYAENETLEHSAPNGMSPSNLSPLSSKNPMEGKAHIVRVRGDEGHQ